MKVKVSFPYDRIGSFSNGNPFCILFVYTKKTPKGFIVKGGSQDVEKWIKEQSEPMVVHQTWWYHGVSRNHVLFYNFNQKVYLSIGRIRKNKTDRPMYELYTYPEIHRGKPNIVKKIKRIPRCWMREYDDLILPPPPVDMRTDKEKLFDQLSQKFKTRTECKTILLSNLNSLSE